MKLIKIEIKDIVKFGYDSNGGVTAWIAFGLKDKDENYKSGEKVPLIVEASYLKNDEKEPKKSAVLFEVIADENNEIFETRIPIAEIS